MDRPPRSGPEGIEEDGDAVADATMTQLWRTTLEVLDSGGPRVQQRAFLSLAKLVGLLDDTALIAVPNDFTKDIVETRLRERVTATWAPKPAAMSAWRSPSTPRWPRRRPSTSTTRAT